jgi:hypothetical protein
MNTAILVNSMGHNQIAHELNASFNKYESTGLINDDLIVMYEDKVGIPNQNVFTQMYIGECYGYIGNVVATNISTASKLLSIPTKGRKFLYIYNFEWLRGILFFYEPLISVICDERLELICRTEEHAKLIENNFNKKPIGILQELDIIKLLEITNGK